MCRDKDYIICFLKGLNENFSTTKSQIILMNPLLGIDTIFPLVIQQEIKLAIPLLDPPSRDASDPPPSVITFFANVS